MTWIGNILMISMMLNQNDFAFSHDQDTIPDHRNPQVDVELINADYCAILKDFREETGINIVYSPNDGEFLTPVTVKLENVPLFEALRKICSLQKAHFDFTNYGELGIVVSCKDQYIRGTVLGTSGCALVVELRDRAGHKIESKALMENSPFSLGTFHPAQKAPVAYSLCFLRLGKPPFKMNVTISGICLELDSIHLPINSEALYRFRGIQHPVSVSGKKHTEPKKKDSLQTGGPLKAPQVASPRVAIIKYNLTADVFLKGLPGIKMENDMFYQGHQVSLIYIDGVLQDGDVIPVLRTIKAVEITSYQVTVNRLTGVWRLIVSTTRVKRP
jgi:hypothetical protein